MIIEENVQKVRDEVAKYSRQVTLIAASKTQTKDTIDAFHAIAPDFLFGENRVQELVEKYEARYQTFREIYPVLRPLFQKLV